MEPGAYVIRVKVPPGVKLMPYWHPEDRVYTAMSGVFYIGLGEQFDGENWRRIRLVPLSFCQAAPLISTEPNPMRMSPR